MSFVKDGCQEYNLKPVMVPFVLENKSWDLYAFEINKGTCVFKGTRVPLNKLANNSQFYVSNANTAGIYARGGYACTFKTKKDHVLFVMNKTNLKKIIYILNYLQKTYSHGISKPHIMQLVTDIRQAYGINTTTVNQYQYFIRIASASNRPIVDRIFDNKHPGRVSFHAVDKRIMTGLEWLFKMTPDIQGVYSLKKHSPAHGGQFHPELAYFKASNILKAHGCRQI